MKALTVTSATVLALILVHRSIQAPPGVQTRAQQAKQAIHHDYHQPSKHITPSRSSKATSSAPQAENKNKRKRGPNRRPQLPSADISASKSVREWMIARPKSLQRSEKAHWDAIINLHPDIQKIQYNETDHLPTTQEMELTLRRLRGNNEEEELADEKLNRRLTMYFKRILQSKGAPSDYIDLVIEHWQRYAESMRRAKNYSELQSKPNDARLLKRKETEGAYKELLKRDRKTRLRNVKVAVKKAQIQDIIKDLEDAKLSTNLDCNEMELQTRTILDSGNHNEKLSINALQQFLTPIHGSDYSNTVASLRRLIRRRHRRREAKRTARARAEAGSNHSTTSSTKSQQVVQAEADGSHSREQAISGGAAIIPPPSHEAAQYPTQPPQTPSSHVLPEIEDSEWWKTAYE